MKVAGSSRPRIRKSWGTDLFYPGSKPNGLGLTVCFLPWEGKSKGGGATFLARVPCHRTRLGVFLRISSPSQCSAKPFEGARCEAQFPAGVQ